MRDDARPVSAEGQAAVSNVIAIDRNAHTLAPGTPVSEEMKKYLASPKPPDRFDTQELSGTFTGQLLEGTESLDIVDVVGATRTTTNLHRELIGNIATQANRDRIAERFGDLRRACVQDLVHAADIAKLARQDNVPLDDLYRRIFGYDPSDGPGATMDLELIQQTVRDRLRLGEVITHARIATDVEEGRNKYGRPPAPGEIEALNDAAAETIEQLQYLRAYPVAPFEVSGNQVDLPWDIAVMPPLQFSAEGEPEYAPEALADFMLLSPAKGGPADLRLNYEPDRDRKVVQVKLGQGGILTRLRLHTNGQISYGIKYHNIPSDHAERVFQENGAGLAFARIRGLLVCLTGDALMPASVTEREVGGSVASTFRDRPREEPGVRITQMLLPRQQALERANVSGGNRIPEGWDGPTQAVGGYIRKLPAGTRARPTAEAEARAYYRSINVPFNGLREGYNFVKGYDRPVASEEIHRRARFREDSNTARFLESQ